MKPKPSFVARYTVALVATGAAVLLRWLLDPLLGDFLPLVTLFGAVAIAVWFGGYAPALLAMALGYVACHHFFIEPRREFGLTDGRILLGLFAYLMSCAIIIGFGEAARVARRRANERGEILRVTLASIGDGVIATDTGGRVTYVNPVAESLTGWARAEAIGQELETVFRIVNEQTRAPVENPVTKALHKGVTVGLANHSILIARDGVERSIDDSAAPIRDANGAVAGCVLIFRDITERRKLERQNLERLEATRMLASIVASSEDAIVSKSLDGIIRSWNAAAERLFGYPADEAVGQPITLIIPPDRAAEENQIITRLRAGDRVKHFETVRRRRDGQLIDVSLTISPIKNEAGQVIGASKIARDISDRKRAEEQIYRQQLELREADRRKDEFLAMLAHELRGPLAPIRNSIEIMKVAKHNPDLIERARDTMDRQVSQLVRLVDDLLDVSRITRNKLELRKEHVELDSIIQQSVDACRALAEMSNHRLTVTLPSEPIHLFGDPVRLIQVLTNLLNNACKYTEPGGEISLAADVDGRDIVIKVKDTGVGIPPDKLTSIFEMFTQVDRSLERSQSGLGIGLTLVRSLVEMHGGSVTAFSGGTDQGSEFVVRLPIVIDDPAARQLSSPSNRRQAEIPRRILVVDDSEDSATSLGLLLRSSGHQVQLAHDGLGALAAAESFRPEVVLLDIGLPKLNGYDVCRHLRRQSWGQNVFLIAVTGWGQDEDRQASRSAGFDHHIIKPVHYPDLLELLSQVKPTAN